MIVGFVDYLILNGVDASKITLLTFYNGQRKRLNRELHSHQNSHAFTGIKRVTVDGYQGMSYSFYTKFTSLRILLTFAR
jgi:helicase required for RNAi-mediated heterochromatin assembly 1